MRLTVLALAACFVAACSQPPALITDKRKTEIVRELQREFARSVDSEKSAVLASTDEESARFVAESREASARVDTLRAELRGLISSHERENLDEFDRTWAQLEAVDAKLLPLAAANTNLKAARLSKQDAAAALDRVLTAISTAEAATKDPSRLRELSAASVAALRIQTLHAPHIASPDEREMTAIETRVAELEKQVAPATTAPGVSEPWTEYQRLTQEIFKLSRQNTNVLSFDMSIHEKRDASKAVEVALKALIDKVHDVPRPSR